MTAEAQDALEYSRAMQQQVQRALMDRGHSACPGNNSAHFSFEDQRVFCGCGKSFEMTGPQSPPPGGVEQTEARDPVQAALAVIDPTLAYSPVDVEMRILDVLARLEMGAVFERDAIVKAAAAKDAYTTAHIIARNSCESTVNHTREDTANMETLELLREWQQAETVAKAVKATMHNLRSILSGYQSVLKSVMEDMKAGGSVR